MSAKLRNYFEILALRDKDNSDRGLNYCTGELKKYAAAYFPALGIEAERSKP